LALAREKLEINKEGKLGYIPEQIQYLHEFASQFSEFSILNSCSNYWNLLSKLQQKRPFALYKGYIGLGPLETLADVTEQAFSIT
jgi:hypothetical protein